MKDLKLISKKDNLYIDSRDVADMIGKQHSHLCRDIAVYKKVISENPKLDFQNFFVESAYKTDGNNKTYPCYLLTKKGCDMVANKLTGEKGILFTAMYVSKFEDMEKQIRQTYLASYQITDPIKRAEKWIEEEKQRQHLELENMEQRKQIEVMSGEIVEMKKKTDYLDRILASKGTVTVTQIAQDYGMSAKAFNKTLADIGIQRKVNGQWILFAKYMANGYVHSKSVSIVHSDGRPDTVLNTEWTQRGRLFLYEALKAGGILPVIERAA